MTKKDDLTDLKDLNPLDFPESRDDSLDVDLGEISIPEINEEEAKKVQEVAAGIAAWMRTYLQKLDGLNAQPIAVQARPSNKKAKKEIWDRFHMYMNHSEAGYRQTAWLEFLLHYVESPGTKTWEDLDQLTKWLAKKQYLEESENGPLETPWGKRFSIPKIASFSAVQFRKIKDAWDKTLKGISQKTAENRKDRVAKIRDEIDVTDVDLLKAKADGTALLYVPGEISLRGEEMAFFNPGLLVTRREDDKLFPVEGIGSFDKKIEEMSRRKTYVLAFTLDWSRPPSKKMLVEDKGFKEEQANDLCFAWYLLRRAFQHLSKKEEGPNEELVSLGSQVNVPASELLLNRQDGIALIELDGSIVVVNQDKSRSVIDKVFFLVERKKNRRLELASVPTHLQTVLPEALRKEYAEGDQFEGLPQPLQALLKMAYFEAYFKQMLEK